MATSNDNKFLDMLNDTVNLGGYTAQSGKVYPPSSVVSTVKMKAILRNIKYRFANANEIFMEGLDKYNIVLSAMEDLEKACRAFEESEKLIRAEKKAQYEARSNHPTIEETHVKGMSEKSTKVLQEISK